MACLVTCCFCAMTVPPQLSPFPTVPVSVGDAAQLACLASRGDSPLILTWRYEHPPGQPQPPPPGLTVVPVSPFNSLLLISRVTPGHRGTYTCRAINRAGHDSHSMDLIVNGMFRFSISYGLFRLCAGFN